MKRKMTSKEELERVRNGSYVDCKECNNQWCIGCLCCRNKLSKSKELDIIEKDLDRLEKLEKENQELKEQVNHFKKVIEVMQNPSKYDLIKKELEILESIKKWSFIEESYKEGYGPYTKFQCIIHTIGMEEDFKKIKEWLDEGKKREND